MLLCWNIIWLCLLDTVAMMTLPIATASDLHLEMYTDLFLCVFRSRMF